MTPFVKALLDKSGYEPCELCSARGTIEVVEGTEFQKSYNKIVNCPSCLGRSVHLKMDTTKAEDER